MINKIKNFFKEEWKFLLLMLFLYLGLTYELPYVIYTPGGHINMSERVEGDNTYSEEGSLSMTYVSMVRGSIPFLALSLVLPNWDIEPANRVTYENTNVDETVEIDKIYMKEAISNAEYVAYKRAGIDFIESEVHNIVTYVSSKAKTNLKYGDEILSVDGEAYSSLKEFQNYVGAKKMDDKVKIEYKRDGKIKVDEVTLIELDGHTKVGLSIATVADYKTDFNIVVKTKDSESGPSGGFITALEIYNKITRDDITKGKKIMGTGTIEKDGTVGEIGGVKYKLLGAYKDGAEVFICPMENYQEAKEVVEKEKMDIDLIGVKTFEEGLERLKEIE